MSGVQVRFRSCVLILLSTFAHSQVSPKMTGRLGLGSRQGHVRVGGGLPSTKPPADNANLASFGLIDFPRSPDSSACGLNSRGDVVGFFGPNVPAWDGTEESYLLVGNTFHKIEYPGASYTGALGINNRREIVGWYTDSSGNGVVHGFLRQGTKYKTIDDPSFQNTIPSNINNGGEVIGEPYDDVGIVHGFMLAKGIYTTIDPPNSTYTEPLGINSAGTIVGDYEDTNYENHGFILQNGQFTTVDYPGESNTDLTDISDQGQMVGGYGDDVIIGSGDWPTPNAFYLNQGVYTPIVLPVSDAQVTWTCALNGHRLTGLYVDSLGNIHGYEAKISK
jgi:hypothetical protein